MRTIEFRPVTASDLGLLRTWLERPHMREWWGDPDEELAYVKEMVEGRDTTQPFIFWVDGAPLGYIQVWFVRDQQSEPLLAEYPWLPLLEVDSVGVDLSIGEPDKLSQGIGTEVLKSFVARLRAEGHTIIIIDPDPANKRAVRAYEKAGFRVVPHLLGKTDDSLIMQHQTL